MSSDNLHEKLQEKPSIEASQQNFSNQNTHVVKTLDIEFANKSEMKLNSNQSSNACEFCKKVFKCNYDRKRHER